MFSRVRLRVILLACIVSVALATTAAAQGMGTLRGTVLDESGNPIEGATVSAENSTGTKNDTTDDKGEFTLVGLRSGQWSVTFEAEGFLPAQAVTSVSGMSGARNRPLTVQLVAGVAMPPGMEGIGADEIKAELEAANALFDQQDYSGAIAAYEALSEKLPDLTAIRMQIANVYRQIQDYDKAVAEYDNVLAKEPTNPRAKMERALTYLVKGDLAAAEAALTELAESGTASAEVLYNLGEVKFAQGNAEEAGAWYDKAVVANPTWGKPLFKLALVALNKADTEAAGGYLEKVVEVDPTSQEAGQAKLILEQIKQQ